MVDEVASLGIKVDSQQIKAADKNLDRLAKTSAKTAKATDALNVSSKKATSALSAEGVAAGRTAKATDALRVSTIKTTASTNALTSAVGGLRSVFGAFAGLLIVNQLKKLSDEATNVENRLRQVTDSTAELNAVFAQLLEISNRTRSELSGTSILYQRLSIASDDLGLSTSELLRLTETINKSFAISGATAQETSGAIRQLSQGLAAGALRGDEFNSVAEQAPAIMRAIADETGLTIGQLREFAATGGITAEIVISALQNVEDEINTKFSKSAATFSQKITIINNNLIAWAAENDNLTISLNATADVVGFVAVIITSLIDVFLTVTRGIIELIKFFSELTSMLPGVGTAFETMNKPASSFLDIQVLILETIGFVNKVLLTLIEVITIPFVAAFVTAKQVIAIFVNEMIDAVTAIAKFTGVGEKFVANLQDSRIEVKSITKELIKFHKQFSIGRESIDGVTDSMIDNLEANEAVTEALEDQNSAATKLARANAALQRSTDAVILDLMEELDALRRTDREQAIYEALKEAGVEANSEFANSIREVVNELFDEMDALDEAKKATKEFEKATKKAARETERAYRKAFEATTDIIFDSIRNWEGGFRGFADNVVDIIKNMLARMAAEFAASKVLQFLSIGVGGGGPSTVGLLGNVLGGAAGSSPLSNIFSGGISSFSTTILSGLNFVENGISAVFQGAGNFLADIGLTTAGDAVGGFGVDLISGAPGTGIATLAPVISALTGALQGFAQSGVKGAIAGGAGGFFGAEAGAALGTAILPGIGTAIGAVLGGLLGGKLGASIFGGEFKTKDFGLQLAVAAGDLVAESFEKQKKKGGLFSSDKKRTITRDLEEGVLADFNTAFDSIQASIIESYAVLGTVLGENVFDSFSLATKQISTKGRTDEEISAAVAEFFGNVADEMVANIEVVGADIVRTFERRGRRAGLSRVFDQLNNQLDELNTLTFERLNELAGILTTTNDVLSAIGVGGFVSSFAGAEGAEKLIEFFGGAEQFVIAAANFEAAFVDKGSIIDQVTNQLTTVFDSLGFSIPATRQGFADLVQGLDVTTESGVEAFGILTSLSELLSAYFSELEKLELEREARDLRISQQRTQLEIQELILLGDAAGALSLQREIELAAMDESLRSLQERIFALQDEQTASDAAAEASEVAAAAASDAADEIVRSTDIAFDALKTSLQAAISTINENLASQLEQADAAFNSTSASISRSIDAMRTSASDLESVIGGIDRAISSLTGGGLSQGQAQAQIQTALTQARGGDFAFGPGFADALTAVSNISEEGFATATEFKRATATTANQLKELKLLTSAELTLEERTLAALEARLITTREQHEATIERLRADAAAEIAILDIIESDFLDLIEIERGTFLATLTVVDAINNLNAALGLEQANVPSFADGGVHSGGLRIVGERGPELEFTGPSNIMSNRDLAGISGGGLVQAIETLTAEVKRGNFAIARNTSKIFKLEDRWDKNGLPPERAVL